MARQKVFELNPSIPESTSAVAARRVLRAVPRVALGGLFVFIGYSKFDGDPKGEWFQIFEQIGLGQWFRIFTGVVQTLGGALLVFRRTLTVGAVLLVQRCSAPRWWTWSCWVHRSSSCRCSSSF